MKRHNGVLVTAAILGISSPALAGVPQVRPARAARPTVHAVATPELQTARAIPGRVQGVVSDDSGGPVAGAMVTLLGATTAMTVTDLQGRFSIDALPVGEYVLRAHLSGFTASRREIVHVGGNQPQKLHLQLHRLDPVATTGSPADNLVAARPIMAAGFDLPKVAPSGNAAEPESTEDHPHNETAWRLRHLKRSILKDAGPIIAAATPDEAPSRTSAFGRAFDNATSLFADLPISGEVNLLTSSAFAPGDLFASAGMPRGIAYVSIGAPLGAGDWAMRAAMSQGELSSWIVAGSFSARPGTSHSYNVGLSYSTQDYPASGLRTLSTVTEGSRNAGEVYGSDRWDLSPRMRLDYGARYARYDYLENRAVFSPRVGVTFEPFTDTRVSTSVAQRMLAPGAEEFVSPSAGGPWLPPERTFAALRTTDPRGLRVERSRGVDFTIEHEFDHTYVVGLRRFYQAVDDQMVTLFGLNLAAGAESPGHYFVASTGAVAADGWALRISSAPQRRVRGSIDYSVTRAQWLSRGDAALVSLYAPAAVRSSTEDLYDVTTSVETNIPETSTRVLVVYKVNTGYTPVSPDEARPGLDGRFEVQVNQALPFGVAGTKWEVLVGVRNLFRDPLDEGSVYDELLVVRPPKRVVGGFLVKF